MKLSILNCVFIILFSLSLYSCATENVQPYSKRSPTTTKLPQPVSKNLVAPGIADPFIITDSGGQVVVTGTGGDRDFNVGLSRARSLKGLQTAKRQEALPKRPEWGRKPMGAEIMQLGDHYLMYFVSKHRLRDVNCLAVASSRDIGGPYRVISDKEPLFCPDGIIGVIAPNPYRDSDNRNYLLFSMFSGVKGHANKGIYIAEMSGDGLTIKGEPRKLIGVDQKWENGHIEGSSLIRYSDKYYLFYTGSTYKAKNHSYAVGYAYSDKIMGPYKKASDNPLLRTSGEYFNPGSPDVMQDKCGNFLLFFHAYSDPNMTGKRSTYASKLNFSNNKVTIDGHFDLSTYECKLSQ